MMAQSYSDQLKVVFGRRVLGEGSEESFSGAFRENVYRKKDFREGTASAPSCLRPASALRHHFDRRRAPRAGNINAGTKIVMLAQTVSAQVDLVDLAIDRWRFRPAQVASPPRPLCRGFGKPRGSTSLRRYRLKIGAASGRQRAQGKQQNATALNRRIRVAAECRRQEAQSEHHQPASEKKRYAADLLAHPTTFFPRDSSAKPFYAEHSGFAAQTPDDGSNEHSAISQITLHSSLKRLFRGSFVVE
jgi:hypothetical protein